MQTTQKMNTTKTAVRRYPQKPERTAPVEFNASKRFDTKVSLNILSDFMKEARKHIRKNDSVLINACTDEVMSHLHFVADEFELSFIITEKN